MQRILLIAAVLLAKAGVTSADERSFRSALMELPPKFLADIPLADRDDLMRAVGNRTNRLDAANGWLHWFSDGHDVRATSMVWAKELPRAGQSSLIIVHMSKPFADGRNPGGQQTFVVERTKDGWEDVTKQVMPAGVDLTMHFRTRKKDTVVEVAKWKQIDRADGRGKAWVFGPRVMDLKWNGEKFLARKPESGALTKN